MNLIAIHCGQPLFSIQRRYARKFFLVMKLTALLILLTVLTTSASTMAQKVTLHEKKAPLEQVLNEISKQTGCNIVYDESRIQAESTVTIDTRNSELKDVLDILFNGRNFEYKISNNSVIIKDKEPSFIDKIKAALAAIDVSGRVVDEKGEPVPGATVKLKDGSQITITDKNGTFILRGVSNKAIAIISSVGYFTKEVALKADLGTIVLLINNSKLDEVQVIAYGTTSKRVNPGSVSSINATEIAKQPVGNVLSAMEGQIAGAVITSSNGLPGSRVNVNIRGASSLQNGTIPLYIVDGVPFGTVGFASGLIATNALNANGLISSNGSTILNAGIDPFSVINPADIERVDVLKDADATAIYGTRGANGVILITTKKAKAGKTKLDVNYYEGVGKVGHFIDFLNLSQYLALRHKAFRNDNITPGAANAPDLVTYDTTKSVDFQRKYMGGTAHTRDAEATISGGDMRTRFLFATGYHKEGTVFPGDNDDQRVSIRFNGDHNSLDKRFNINLSVLYAYDQSILTSGDLSSAAILPPDYPLFNKDGSLYWDSNFTNPEASLLKKYIGTTNNLVSNLQLKYNLFTGLDVKVNTGFNKITLDQNQQNPVSSQNPNTAPTNNASFATSDQETYIVEPQITYAKPLGKGLLSLLGGASFQNSLTNASVITASNYSSAGLLSSISGAASYSASGTNALYRYNSFFGRANYNWDQKYIIEGNIRRDGSSRFGPDNRFGTFGSGALAWVFSNETVVKDINSISFGKIRASYGITGNDQIPNYQFLPLYTLGSSAYAYQGTSILYPTGLANPDLHWETTTKAEIGLDMGFFKDRILLTFNYYQNRSGNQLSNISLARQTGFVAYPGNFPAVIESKGEEIELNTKNITGKLFSWRTSVNLTIPKNRVLSVSPSYLSAASITIGQSRQSVLRYTYDGVDPATGKPLFLNKATNTGVLLPTYPTDQSVIGDTDPKLYGGITNELQYGNWSLSFFIQGVRQDGDIIRPIVPGTLNNVAAYWLSTDMWQKPGDVSGVPRASTSATTWGSLSSSNFTWGDNSYVRLKNVSVAYTFNTALLNRLKMSNLRVYAQGQNIWTLTKNKFAFDPETSYSTPLLRVITFGLNCSF